MPVFRERLPEPGAVALVQPPPDRKPHFLLAGLCAILLAVVIVLAIQLQGAKKGPLESSPNLNALWSQMLPPNGRTALVVTDSSLSFFQELLPRQLSLPEYLKPDTWTKAASLDSNPELQEFAQRAAHHRFTSLANVTIAYRLARLGGNWLSLFSARDFNIPARCSRTT